jgi:hypothetical protein
MKTAKRLSLLLDLLLLGASITRGPIGAQIRTIAVVVIAAIGAFALFTCAVLAIAVIQQRQPPYPM